MKNIALLTILCFILTSCPPPPKVGTGIFVVGEGAPFHGDSYVIELTNPDDAAHAREIIRNPSSTPMQILVATIDHGPGALPNQDFLGGGASWSWHVVEFVGFAEFTIEILDGWPGFIEQDVQGWIDNTNGTIGFWNYTVVQEIESDQLKDLQAASAVQLNSL